jgi:outer membrane murein-binding lipoprotein Lpp
MSWHDPARSLESDADTALRNELRGLLGMTTPATSYFEAEPTPELILLADDLRREALRRNRTARKKGSWMLLAAALPFALALGGVGVWGVSQKHKADHLAAAVAHQAAEIQQLASAQHPSQPQPQTAAASPQQLPARKGQPAQVLLLGQAPARNKPKELVIPVQRSAEPNLSDTQRVKAR